MKSTRLFAAFLILVLVTSQALAAVCVTSCVLSDSLSNSLVVAQDMNSMSAEDCQHSEPDNNDYKNVPSQCNMAGCHTAQTAASFNTLINQFTDIANIDLPQFLPSVISAELSPPIKPPA